MQLLEAAGTAAFGVAAFLRPRRAREHLLAYRLRRLRAVLAHAERHVPHYREQFARCGVGSADLRSLDDLARFPVLGRRELREAAVEAFVDERLDPNRLFAHQTSGSTGMPVRVLRAGAEERRLNLLRWRAYFARGLRVGDRIAQVTTIWDAPPAAYDRLLRWAGRLGALDRRYFDCFVPAVELLPRIAEYRPQVLAGYPGVLARLARGVAPGFAPPFRPRVIYTGGEAMSPLQRRLVQSTFGAPVFESYGASECNLIAWQCPVTGEHHVCDDGVIVEICRDGIPVRAGEPGDVVITALHSRAMPLVRYAIGDIAVAGHACCECGAPFSTLREIRGRVIDEFPLADGRRLHPFELLNEIVQDAADWIVEYRLTQTSLDRFTLLVVPQGPAEPARIERLRGRLLAVLGSGIRFDIEPVAEIAPDASGKLHYCRSMVSGGG